MPVRRPADAPAAQVLRSAPELAAQLAQPYAWDRKGEVPPGCAPWFAVPVFCAAGAPARVVSMYDRSFIRAAQARFGAAAGGPLPPLSAEATAALDAADAAAASDALRLDMRLAPGDAQFLHSHVTWHARGAFSDGGDGLSGRHLLRLWLAPPADVAWELPAAFAPRYGDVAHDAAPPRGGIRVAGAAMCAPLTAEQPL